MAENEKQFESNIEAFLISPAGGYEKATDAGYTSSSGMALDIHLSLIHICPFLLPRFKSQATLSAGCLAVGFRPAICRDSGKSVLQRRKW